MFRRSEIKHTTKIKKIEQEFYYELSPVEKKQYQNYIILSTSFNRQLSPMPVARREVVNEVVTLTLSLLFWARHARTRIAVSLRSWSFSCISFSSLAIPSLRKIWSAPASSRASTIRLLAAWREREGVRGEEGWNQCDCKERWREKDRD